MMGEPVSFGWLFVKTILAMVVIIGLALFIIRYLIPKLTMVKGRGPSQLDIIEVKPIEMRKSVYIVNIAGRKVALGVTESNINYLCDVPDANAANFSPVSRS